MSKEIYEKPKMEALEYSDDIVLASGCVDVCVDLCDDVCTANYCDDDCVTQQQ